MLGCHCGRKSRTSCIQLVVSVPPRLASPDPPSLPLPPPRRKTRRSGAASRPTCRPPWWWPTTSSARCSRSCAPSSGASWRKRRKLRGCRRSWRKSKEETAGEGLRGGGGSGSGEEGVLTSPLPGLGEVGYPSLSPALGTPLHLSLSHAGFGERHCGICVQKSVLVTQLFVLYCTGGEEGGWIIYLFFFLFICSFICLLIHVFILLFIHSLFTYFILFSSLLFTRSFIYLLIHLFILLFIPSFIIFSFT